MTQAAETLLDATDRVRRLMQLGVVWLGVLVLIVARVLLRRPSGHLNPAGLTIAGIGLAAIVISIWVRVRWEVPYKGHVILFENDPLRGERLYIDGEVVAKGGRGYRLVLQGTIKEGAGAGDRITSVSEAGMFHFHCRLTAEPPAG